jgi:spermidine synthase
MDAPLAIRAMLRRTEKSETAPGAVDRASTAGSIIGTFGATFYLIPLIGTAAIAYSLGAASLAAGFICGLIMIVLPRIDRWSVAVMLMTGILGCAAFATPTARAEPLFDESVRAAMLQRPDGRLAHVESEYNDIYVTKRRNELMMSFQLKGWYYTESVTDLRNPDKLVLRYSQLMSIATIYPEEPKKILMLGLGAGSISTYLGRFMPDAEIDTVEIDRRVIDVAKEYFGLRETKRVRYLAADGRVFLNRNKGPYDLILLDAYRGGFVPFHLLTREFYELVKQRLTPGGVVAANVHDGTKLYHSTVKTIGEVFPGLDLYPSGEGEVIAIATQRPLPDRETLAALASALQKQYNVLHPLTAILRQRMVDPMSQAASGDVITDDFAPVNLYETMGREHLKRKR